MMKKQKYEVTGMTCSACSSHVEKAVGKLLGIKQVTVNLLTNSMQVEYDEAVCNEEKIIEAVEKAGYGASLLNDREGKGGSGQTKLAERAGRRADDTRKNQEMKIRLIVSLCFHGAVDDCIHASHVLYVAEPSDAGAVYETVPRERECIDLCIYTVFADLADYLCKPKIFSDRV